MKFIVVSAAISAIAVANGQKHRHSSIRRVLQVDEPMSMSMMLDPNKKGSTKTTGTTGTTGKSSSRSKMGGCNIDGFYTPSEDICMAAIPPEVDSSCNEDYIISLDSSKDGTLQGTFSSNGSERTTLIGYVTDKDICRFKAVDIMSSLTIEGIFVEDEDDEDQLLIEATKPGQPNPIAFKGTFIKTDEPDDPPTVSSLYYVYKLCLSCF